MSVGIKTMRDIWDKGKEKKEVKKYKTLPPEIEKYYLEHLARKQVFLEARDEITKIFADYEKRLGGAGFSKV